MAMGAVALLSVPSLAKDLDVKTVDVTITVAEYGAISGLDNLSVTVSKPDGFGGYDDSDSFKVLCNVNSTLTVTAPETSEATPGTGYYPTAIGDSGDAIEHRIAFTVKLENLDTELQGRWGEIDYTHAEVSFNPTMENDPYYGQDNAKIYLNTYMEWGRDGDALAPPGTYTTTLTLTLAQAP